MIVAGFVLLGVVTLAVMTTQDLKGQLLADPTGWAYGKLDIFGTMFQIGAGIVWLLLGARLIGMESSFGTIRIIYARGTGRLHLLLAQMTALAVLGICLLAGFVLIVGAIMAALISSLTGSLDAVQSISSEFWADLGRWALVEGMSMG